MGLKRDWQGSMPDLAIELRNLMSLRHPSIALGERELLAIDYLIHAMNNATLQRHLLTADTTTIASTVQSIEEYLAVGNIDQLACKKISKRKTG